MNPSYCRSQRTNIKPTVTISLRRISMAEKITLGDKVVNINHCISDESLNREFIYKLKHNGEGNAVRSHYLLG